MTGEVILFTGEPPIVKRTESICNDFPIRPDFLAQVLVPRDMTQREADRLAEFIRSMASPDNGSEPR